MPSEEDLRKHEEENKDIDADKITEEGKAKLKELKSALDKHIKGVKENELEDLGELNEKATKAMEEAMKKENDGPPFGNFQLTPEQRVERRLKKRITELEERVQKLESYLWQQSTKGYIKKQ